MASHLARLVLTGGPFDGIEAAFAPPDTAVPAQIVWSGWTRHGFTAWLYEYRGERRGDPIDQLVYRPTGRTLSPDEIPPVIADAAESWVDATILLARIQPLHPKLRLP